MNVKIHYFYKTMTPTSKKSNFLEKKKLKNHRERPSHLHDHLLRQEQYLYVKKFAYSSSNFRY